jgi:tRNA (adenine57-N1/adenine58-N1)-methyltransferase catalytic subunit
VTDVWVEGDTVALKRSGVPPILARLVTGPQRIGEFGVLDLSSQLGQPPGGSIVWLDTSYRVVRPSLSDLFATIHRNAQIITPKDAAQLIYLAGVAAGGRVGEAGAGSGALTIALAYTVGPSGHVTTYDRRADFLETARANVRRTGLEPRVTFRERDVARDGLDVTDLTSIVLDLPEPWEVLPSARSALVPGGYVATFTPTYNQLERTVRSLRNHGFDEVRAVELLERSLHVGDGGTRPEFEMLGHTGFLAAGRRVD